MKKKALGIALTIVGAVLIYVSAVNLVLILIDRSSHEYFLVASGSMEPALGEGEWVKVKLGMTINDVYAAPKDASPPGDIVASHSTNYVILHRAVEKITDPSYYLITQGDANPGPDAYRAREIRGIVAEINPPIWTYNYIFWGVIFSIGIAIMLGGVVLRRSKRIEVHRADNTRAQVYSLRIIFTL